MSQATISYECMHTCDFERESTAKNDSSLPKEKSYQIRLGAFSNKSKNRLIVCTLIIMSGYIT